MNNKRGVGKELRTLNNLIKRYFDNYSHKKLIEHITGTNGWIIGYLADNANHDVYQKNLEEEFSITRSTASKNIILMEHKGLIERKSVPQDARLKKLVLTQKAMELRNMMCEDVKQMEETLTEGFTAEELDNLHFYIEKMKDNISNAKQNNN